MRIYLVRHGDAVPEEDAGSDRDRWLSSRGREAARVLGRLLREQGVVPDAILTSPLPRAVQTAELLAQALDFLVPIASRRCFEPSAQPRVAADELRASGASVLVVSHEPAVSSLAAYLAGRPAFPQFRTAQCYALENGAPTFTARSDLGVVQTYFLD
ncbi:MAG: phosphohistidine phosphatase SixA [Deltaproteobacteria bacterium]|nr:phosphohistidine phosphatase SixA [Deltaproteobacteria bacterium]MCW5809213.1 phosphohistidine phosphatase SixA [Deltaproteobacteria bacterium]